MNDRDDAATVAGGGDGDEPAEIGDRRQKHISVTTAAGDRVEHGDVYIRHSASGFAVSSKQGFPEDETTRYEKSALRRVEVTQHHAACFITTATAGEGAALDTLRRFRDDVLARRSIGRRLLTVYDLVSPPVARTLAHHPEALTTRGVRWLVVRCAGLARRRAASRARPARAAMTLGLTLAYTVGLAFAIGGHAAIRIREWIGSRLDSALVERRQEASGQADTHRQDLDHD